MILIWPSRVETPPPRTLYILLLYILLYIGEMNSALSASPVALCECFCREKNKNEKNDDDVK